jgi:DNA-binding MarR family transcriptional regulator
MAMNSSVAPPLAQTVDGFPEETVDRSPEETVDGFPEETVDRFPEGTVDRFLELRPTVSARLRALAAVPEELREGFDSLTARQIQALGLLPRDGMGMHQLADALGVTAATASTLAGRLVAKGLAVRGAAPDDRRVVRLAPTDRGLDLARRYHEVQRKMAGALFDRLTAEQATALLEMMQALASDLPEPGGVSGGGVR